MASRAGASASRKGWQADYLELVSLLLDHRPLPQPILHQHLHSVLSNLPSADQHSLDKLFYAIAASPALWNDQPFQPCVLLHLALRNVFLLRFTAASSNRCTLNINLSRFLAASSRALAPLSRSPPHALPALTIATASLAALQELRRSHRALDCVVPAEDDVLALYENLLQSNVQDDRQDAVLSWLAAQVVPSIDSLRLTRSSATVPLMALLTRSLSRLLAAGRLFDELAASLDLPSLSVRPGSATATELAALSADPLCPMISPIAISLATLAESTRICTDLERPLVALADIARRVHQAWRTATRSAPNIPRFGVPNSSISGAEPGSAADSWLKTVLFCTLAVLGGIANRLTAERPPCPAPLVCTALDVLGALHFIVLRFPDGSLAMHPQVLKAFIGLAAQDRTVAQMVVEAAEPAGYGSVADEPLGRSRALFYFTLLTHLAPKLVESYMAKAFEGVWVYLDRPDEGLAAHGALVALVGSCGPDTLCMAGPRYLGVLMAVPSAQPVLDELQVAHAAESLFEALLSRVPSQAHKLLTDLITHTTLASNHDHRTKLMVMLISLVGVFGGQPDGQVDKLVEKIWTLVKDQEEAKMLFGALEKVCVPRNFGVRWWLKKTSGVGARL